jgi:hypothetical protein
MVKQNPSLTLEAMALFFHIISQPQVTLNLAAQVTWDLAVRRLTPPPLPPQQLSQGPNTISIDMISFNTVYVACQVGN